MLQCNVRSLVQSFLSTPQPFDTRLAGTDEPAWLSHLSATPLWQPEESTLVVVSPHPDDETLGAGGLMRASTLRGQRVIVVSITDGEKARPADAFLRQRRQAELDGALGCLSGGRVPIEVVRFHLPDGEVSRYEKALRNAIAEVCTPDSLLVAPFERDGHTDHEAAGRASIAAARARGIPLARYPIWAWHRLSCRQMPTVGMVRFSLDPGLQRCKAAALTRFESQREPHPDGAIVPDHVIAHFLRPFESFILGATRP